MLSLPLLRRSVTGVAVFALALALPSIAAVLKTDPTKSAVSAVFKQMSVPVEATFRKFDAHIDFNPAKPETSKAIVEIDIASFDLGDPAYNKEVLKKEWFDSARFPKASFVSSAMTPGANGAFNVAGKLTIKGRTVDVSFPLNVRKDGARQVFEGALPIKRLAFNIGEGEWKDTSMVADEVVIKFRVVTTQ